MTRIEETRLPGVGVRHDFVTREGRRLGVITHRGGHQDLLVYDERDPDRCAQTVRLQEQDSRALSELLGAAEVAATLSEDLRQSVEGLTIDWVPVRTASASQGHTIADTRLRQRTGVSIVALVRGDTTIASPEPGETLRAGDTAVVVGTPDGIRRAIAVLQG